MTTPKSVRIELAASLAGLRGTNCFCENGIGNPMYGGECSRACIAASNALARHAAEPDHEPLLLALLRAAQAHLAPHTEEAKAAWREVNAQPDKYPNRSTWYRLVAALDACAHIVLPPEEETHG